MGIAYFIKQINFLSEQSEQQLSDAKTEDNLLMKVTACHI